jgi:hypothetical protein
MIVAPVADHSLTGVRIFYKISQYDTMFGAKIIREVNNYPQFSCLCVHVDSTVVLLSNCNYATYFAVQCFNPGSTWLLCPQRNNCIPQSLV